MDEVREVIRYAGMTLDEYTQNEYELAFLTKAYSDNTYHSIPLALPILTRRIRKAIRAKMNFEIAFKVAKLQEKSSVREVEGEYIPA